MGVAAACVAGIYVAQRILIREAAGGHSFRNQIIMLVLSATAALLVILVFPMGDALRGQLLGLLGIIISAAIALSSTTVLGNGMAGLMMRAVQGFRIGDFIKTEQHFGRVTEQGLFHTEIQTEDRDLTTLPNLYLVTHPVTTIRTSGTIVSATLSLGYDVPRSQVERLLVEGAGKAGLKDPFVQILELGDHSVTYRVAGLLEEVKQLLSARSRLKARAMDALHQGGVEIVSPAFMNQRVFPHESRFIPASAHVSLAEPEGPGPEELAFDKAEEAEMVQALKLSLAGVVEEIDQAGERLKGVERALEKDQGGEEGASAEADKSALEERLARLRARRDRLERVIAARQPGDRRGS